MIKHTGYNKESVSKYQRNLELLQFDAAERPDDVFIKFHLANTYFALKDFDKSRTILLDILDNNELSNDQNEMVHIKLAQLALSDDNLDGVKRYTDFVSNNVNIEGLRLFILASACLTMKQLSAAKELFEHEALKLSSMVDNRQVDQALHILNKIPGI